MVCALFKDVPVWVRACTAVVLWAAWLVLAGREAKAVSVAMATSWSGIEWFFCLLTDGHGHTTKEQWLANIAYLPFGFLPFLGGSLASNAHALSPRYAFDLFALPASLSALVAFPLLVYGLEIVEGYTMMFFNRGVNPAWDYTGNADMLCHGNIRLKYWPLWVLLGVAVRFFVALLDTAL